MHVLGNAYMMQVARRYSHWLSQHSSGACMHACTPNTRQDSKWPTELSTNEHGHTHARAHSGVCVVFFYTLTKGDGSEEANVVDGEVQPAQQHATHTHVCNPQAFNAFGKKSGRMQMSWLPLLTRHASTHASNRLHHQALCQQHQPLEDLSARAHACL